MSLLQRSQTPARPAALKAPALGSCQTGFISDLLLRCGCGDEDAFVLLFDTFYPLVVATTATLVSPHGADRAVEAAFVAIWEDAPLYRPGGGSSVSWIMGHVIDACTPTQEASFMPAGESGFASPLASPVLPAIATPRR